MPLRPSSVNTPPLCTANAMPCSTFDSAYAAADSGADVGLRQAKYLNNIVE